MCTFHLDICQKYWQLWSSGYCCQRHSYLEYEMNEYLDLNLNLQPKKFSINGDIKKEVVTSDAASSKRAMVPPVMIAFAFSSVFLSSFVAFLFFSLLCFFSGSKWASSSHIYTQTASMNLAFIHQLMLINIIFTSTQLLPLLATSTTVCCKRTLLMLLDLLVLSAVFNEDIELILMLSDSFNSFAVIRSLLFKLLSFSIILCGQSLKVYLIYCDNSLFLNPCVCSKLLVESALKSKSNFWQKCWTSYSNAFEDQSNFVSFWS